MAGPNDAGAGAQGQRAAVDDILASEPPARALPYYASEMRMELARTQAARRRTVVLAAVFVALAIIVAVVGFLLSHG